jgi:hypothetical protein
MCSGRSDWALPQPGFPIRRSTDQSLVDSSPWLIAATHVLHRHLAPRHPPLALCNLKSHTPRLFSGEKSKEPHFQNARARYAVLKGRAGTVQGPRLRYVAVAGTPHTVMRARPRAIHARSAVVRIRRLPLPQNRAVNTRNDGISVVSVTARSLESDWRVRRGRDEFRRTE